MKQGVEIAIQKFTVFGFMVSEMCLLLFDVRYSPKLTSSLTIVYFSITASDSIALGHLLIVYLYVHPE